MKKHKIFTTLCLAIIPFVATANLNQRAYGSMNVEIVNLGAENCILNSNELTFGELKNSSLPKMLSADGTPAVFQIIASSKNEGHNNPAINIADLTLNYTCGTYKKFTLHMKQYFKKNHVHGALDVEMSNAVDVFETHKVSPPQRKGTYSNNEKSGTVSWVISN